LVTQSPLFYEDEHQLEGSEDIARLHKDAFSSSVVSGNDWTTETLLNQINKGNIQLNPDFQRRDAWDRSRKSRFVESLILGLPVPQVVLAESKERRGSFIVLDGKQRLLTIRQFVSNQGDPEYDPLKLQGLEIRDDLNGKTFSDLREDLTLYDDLSSFENQPIRTVVIKNWDNEDVLYHIFLRLNTGSVPLSPQELRQALHPGPFLQFLDIESSKSIALRDILNLSKPDFRMRDAELLLRYFSFKNYLFRYTGSLKPFLDEVCRTTNARWDQMAVLLSEQLQDFELAHAAIVEIFEGNQYRRWNGTYFENRFNRAVFDVMMLTFSYPAVRAASYGHEIELLNAYRDLCENDRDFADSLQSTTKSLFSTYSRISKWTEAVNFVLGTEIPVPLIAGYRPR